MPEPKTTTSLIDYYAQLEAHDWFHAMSDDNRVHKLGEAADKKLRAIASESPEHNSLYNAMKEHVWRRGEKPAKPMEKTFRTGEK